MYEYLSCVLSSSGKHELHSPKRIGVRAVITERLPKSVRAGSSPKLNFIVALMIYRFSPSFCCCFSLLESDVLCSSSGIIYTLGLGVWTGLLWMEVYVINMTTQENICCTQPVLQVEANPINMHRTRMTQVPVQYMHGHVCYCSSI